MNINLSLIRSAFDLALLLATSLSTRVICAIKDAEFVKVMLLVGILVFSFDQRCAAQGWVNYDNTQREIKVLKDRRAGDLTFIADLKEGNETLNRALNQKQSQLDEVNERISSTTDASRIASANLQRALVTSDINKINSRISENTLAITKYERELTEVERRIAIITPKPKPNPDPSPEPRVKSDEVPTVIKVTHTCKSAPKDLPHSDSTVGWHVYEFRFSDGTTMAGGANNRDAALKGIGLTLEQLCKTKTVIVYGGK